MLVTYTVTFRDAGGPTPGLTPTFVHFKVPAAAGANITPQPTIFEIAGGDYGFAYDPEIGGEAKWIIDAGASITSDAERYISGFCALDSSRTLALAYKSGAVEADALAGATAVTVAAGLALQPGSVIAIERGTGVGSSFVVDSYAGTTITPTLPIPTALNGTSVDPAIRSRYIAILSPVATPLPAVDGSNQVIISPTSTTTQLDSVVTTIGTPVVSLAADIAAADSAAVIADAVLDELTADHVIAGSFGEAAGRLDAPVSTRATPAQVATEAAAALTVYDAATKAELDAGLAALNDVTAAEFVTALLAEQYEGVETVQGLLRLVRAVLYGKANGLGTVTARFRDAADTKDRIIATVDAVGNRTALTLDPD